MSRTIEYSIFRFNPHDPESKPHMQTYMLEQTPNMNLFIVLNRIREEQDPTLCFDFCCRAGICGSCAMVINGRPGLACQTQVASLPDKVTLLPLPVFKMLGDLCVDTGVWFREMYQNTESWVHTTKPFDPTAEEERMDNSTAEAIYELERCLECGCCVGACATARMRPDFKGAVSINRIARFAIDPRDERTDAEFFELIGSDSGVFGCMGLLACEDTCPKGLPLQTQLAFIRRKMGISAIRQLGRRK